MLFIKKNVFFYNYLLDLNNILKTVIFNKSFNEFVFIIILITNTPVPINYNFFFRIFYILYFIFSPPASLKVIDLYKIRNILPLFFALKFYFKKTFRSRANWRYLR